MPQVLGSKVTLRDSKTHAYHGIAGIYHKSSEMGRYIDFKVTPKEQTFVIEVINSSNHALFGQAFRQGELHVSILRGKEQIPLNPFIFTRIPAANGVESMPWQANSTLKDTLIYAKKAITYDTQLQKGDTLVLTLGVRLLSAKGAEALGLDNNKEVQKFRVLKTEKLHY